MTSRRSRLTAKTISVLAVLGRDGPKSAKELIARAKAEPGKLNYGAGTITAQLMGHLFHKAAGLDIVYVPFKGTPETVNGLLTGSVQLIYAANQIVAPLIASGQVRALAKLDRDAPPGDGRHADARRKPLACRISRTCRSGSGWSRRRVRRKPIIDKINAEVVKILADPAVKEKSERTGNYPGDSTARAVRRLHPQGSRPLVAGVIKETGIKLD